MAASGLSAGLGGVLALPRSFALGEGLRSLTSGRACAKNRGTGLRCRRRRSFSVLAVPISEIDWGG